MSVLSADSSGIDLAVLSQYGVLGVMFLFVVGSLLTGKLVAGWVYKRIEQQLSEQREWYERELERERSEKTALRARMDNDIIPLLTDTGHLLREALRTLGRDKGA